MRWYFITSGIVLNMLLAITALYVSWVWFIWPAFEAASMVRWYSAIHKKHPSVMAGKSWLRLFISCYEIFGRDFEAISNRYGRWESVGDWVVYNHSEE